MRHRIWMNFCRLSPVPKYARKSSSSMTVPQMERVRSFSRCHPMMNSPSSFMRKTAVKAQQSARLCHTPGEYVLIQDSDLEYDPQDYEALVRPLKSGEANVVYGVRPDRPERGLRFYLGARFLTHLTNLLYGANIHDEATCYKVFRRSLLKNIPLQCRRFEFCPEVTAKLCRLGEKIFEVPIS